jgi:hypothetical protein
MAKMYVVKNSNGKFSRGKGWRRRWVDNIWEATLFNRKCDASNSKGAQFGFGENPKGVAVRVEVRIKEDI